MSCPTCDHTMARLGCQYSECAGSWACPRCGTLKIGHEDGHVDVIVPALVGRCRSFRDTLDVPGLGSTSAATLKIVWDKLGVAEAINTPEDRP